MDARRWGHYIPNFQKFWVLYLHCCTDEGEIFGVEKSILFLAKNFTFIGTTCRPVRREKSTS